MSITYKILTGGSCGQIEKITNRTKPFKHIQFPAHFFLIQHEKMGNMLVDTGYSEYLLNETKIMPYSLYAKVTPINYQSEDSAVKQLRKLGIEKEEISYIFITHFHADHIAGIRDFPNATFICSKKAFEFLKNKKGLKALKHAFIPSLLPDHFEKRVCFIEDYLYDLGNDDAPYIKDLSPNRKLFDLFGDGTVLAMELPGHAIGQFGLFFQTEKEKVWLIADAVWDSDAYRYYQLPNRITNLILYNYDLFKQTMKHIHDYYQKHDDVFIIPSHCREVKGGIIA